MAKFVLLYMGGGGMPQTDAERTRIMNAWNTWLKNLGSAVVDQGNPFSPAVKKVASNGAISDVQAANMPTGYTIVKADSLDKAARLAQDCPALMNGGSVSVFETFEVM